MRNLLSIFVVASTAISVSADDVVESPLSPRDAISYIELADDVTLELVAAEPDVIDPVAVRFDESRRMWVVEMRDYPHGPRAGERPLSRIRVLVDRDRDGVYESASTFADNLLFATGIQPWKGGVFATVSGKVIYLQDTDNDGLADESETWFTGFAEENSQLRANHPRLGLDGWIYVANGLRGGAVVGTRDGDEPVDLKGADFRFHPKTREYEAISGPGQYGLTFDWHGNRFVCSNRHPLDHVVLERRYQGINRLAPLFAPLQAVAAAGEDSRIFPISDFWTTSNLHEGQFTAACGALIYRGDGLPPDYESAAFTCDPTGNLIHAEQLTVKGPTFEAKPMFTEREFLASRDSWFRPVNLEIGPDGAMYVVDMYRAVIEHPQFMPTELKERADLLYGNDRGRIYRIRSKTSRQSKPFAFESADEERLIQGLAEKNAWNFDTALRQMHERGVSEEGLKVLRQVAISGSQQRTRIAAIEFLAANQEIDVAMLKAIINDKERDVSRSAIQLAENFLSEHEDLKAAVVDRLSSPSAAIQFQAALSLAATEFDRTNLGPLFWNHTDDIWLHRALLISAGDRSADLFAELATSENWTRQAAPLSASQRFVMSELARMAAANPNNDYSARILTALGSIPRDGKHLLLRFEVAHNLAGAMSKGDKSLSFFKRHADPLIREPVLAIFSDALLVATDSEAPDPLRSSAIVLLANDPEAVGTIQRLALSAESPAIQTAAIQGLARMPTTDPWLELLGDFPELPPEVRIAVLDGVLRDVERTKLLLEAIDAGVIGVVEIDPLRMRRLKTHRDESIRQRVKELLDELYPEERKEAIAAHRQALNLEGDALNGREVFKKNCASCHRIAGVGRRIGPDISDSRTKTPAQLLTDILEPNIAIDANYIGYTIQTADGKVHSGLIEAVTEGRVTLRLTENNTTVTLARDEIDQMISTGASLMPEGFEKNISIQEMADLIAFIKNWRYLDGSVPIPLNEQTNAQRDNP